METISWIWLISGLILLISEIVIPGGVIAFLGVSAMLIALGQWMGLIEGMTESFTYWFILSMGSTLLFRGMLTKMVSGKSHIEYSGEEIDAFGRVVDVIEEVSPEHSNGRIRFNGTTWDATSMKETIPPGSKVKIIERENLVWLVEACPMDGNEEGLKPEIH